MKVVAILLAAIAMASAQGVNVVDNNPGPGQVSIVEQPGDAAKTVGQNQDIDPSFGRPSIDGNNVINNPDPGFYQGGSSGVINNPDPGFYQGGSSGVIIQNPDQGFYLPSAPVDPGRPFFNNRPQKYPNPAARGGN